MFLSKRSPGFYNPVDLEVIKKRKPTYKIRAESQAEVEAKK